MWVNGLQLSTLLCTFKDEYSMSTLNGLSKPFVPVYNCGWKPSKVRIYISKFLINDCVMLAFTITKKRYNTCCCMSVNRAEQTSFV